MRLQRSLSGAWAFQLDPEGTLDCDTIHPDRTITVPLPWQAAFPELERYGGYAWYQHSFELDEAWLGGEVLLEFGAVDYWCQVYVNGQCVGEHEGGYTPFRLPIRHAARPGENTLSVRVYDTAQQEITFPRWRDDVQRDGTQPPFEPDVIPHGKQTWYIDASGIWQDVTLTAVPLRYIDRVHITPNIHTGEAQVDVRVGGAAQAGVLRVSIAGQTATASLAADQPAAQLSVTVSEPALWTPDTPALYSASVQLELGQAVDEVTVRFGYREITTRDGYLLLNGQPIYLLCALDQDFYPDTIYTVPSDDFLRVQFQKAKELGLNSLRCHIKIPDPRYLDLADEIGLLIWAEIPSWRTFYPKTTVHPAALHLDPMVKQRVRGTLAELIERDYNHPSVIIWTLVNEDWGTAMLLSELDRAWLAEMFDFCKQQDPTRLVVDNSPCPAPWGLSVHVKSDLDDFHIYTNIPDSAEHFEQFVEQFGLRPLWTFSNTGDAQRTGREPLIISEFGNWGLPTLKSYDAHEPDWFRLGGWWAPWEGEPGYAHGVWERFEQLGLNGIWPDYGAFAEATQWHAFQALKFEIEAMRRQPGIQGYVITELSDTYWESNGLLDFARNRKVFHDRFAAINAPDVVVPSLRRYAYWDDETASVQLHVSHYSNASWSAASVRVETGGQTLGSLPVGDLPQARVLDLGSFAWPLPSVQAARTAVVTLHAEADIPLAQNTASVLVLPAAWRQAVYEGPVAVMLLPPPWGEAGSLPPAYSCFAELGYTTSPRLTPDTGLLITDRPTAEMLDWVRSGGDMLYLSSNRAGSPFFWQHSRDGIYGGNWISSFCWLRAQIHRRLEVDSPLSLPFLDVMPTGVILGLPVTDPAIHRDLLAGQVTGWLRHPAVHTVQFRYGRGRVIMTTFRILDTMAYQPVAVAMLHDLIDHLTSDVCQPELKANYEW